MYELVAGSFSSIKVAAISLKPVKWNKSANADKLESMLRKAARTKAELLVATEGVLEGYVVNEVISDRTKIEAMRQVAEPIDGPNIRRFRSLARSLKKSLAFGFAERIGTEIFNAAIFIDHQGRIAGKYHKTQLNEGTDQSCMFNRVGKKLRAFNTPFGRVGFLICNDRWNPNIARALVLDGAQMLLICAYGSKKKEQNETVLARARENGVPIVEANVGVNVIVSKGEVAAYQWGNDKITTAVVDIPIQPSTKAARVVERGYLKWQKKEMFLRWRKTMRSLRKGARR